MSMSIRINSAIRSLAAICKFERRVGRPHAINFAGIEDDVNDTRNVDIAMLVSALLTEVIAKHGIDRRNLAIHVREFPNQTTLYGYVAFVRLDRYIPDLLDQSKAIETKARIALKRQYQVSLLQIYWRWGEKASTPFDIELASVPSQQRHTN